MEEKWFALPPPNAADPEFIFVNLQLKYLFASQLNFLL
jgi:hypothetical protein